MGARKWRNPKTLWLTIPFFSICHRYVQLLEDTFTVPFAAQMLIVTVGMSITLLQVRLMILTRPLDTKSLQRIQILYFFMLQITQENSDILEKTRYVFYIIGQLIHLFFLSFEGQRLIDHSLQICDKM